MAQQGLSRCLHFMFGVAAGISASTSAEQVAEVCLYRPGATKLEGCCCWWGRSYGYYHRECPATGTEHKTLRSVGELSPRNTSCTEAEQRNKGTHILMNEVVRERRWKIVDS